MKPAELTAEHVHDVCKVGQGAECCRYLAVYFGGWSCQKHTSLRALLDGRAAAGSMTARGDNCGGVDERS